jgi:pimeloyl-ACP methyl ester carboxylesterase
MQLITMLGEQLPRLHGEGMKQAIAQSEGAARTPKGAVVLLHGHGRTGRSMRLIATALARAGYSTFSPSYAGLRQSMTAIVDHLKPRISEFAEASEGPVHIVTHSLGGLVARALLTAKRPRHLGRVVMLAPPNAGSELADLLFRLRLDRLILGPVGTYLRTSSHRIGENAFERVDFDLGIIAGNRALDPVFPRFLLPRPNDGKVAVASTRVAGMSDHMVLPVSHTLMVYDRHVIAHTLTFLENGSFSR